MSAAEPSVEIWREALAVFERLLTLGPDERSNELSGLACSHPEVYPHVLKLLRADSSADGQGFLAGDALRDAAAAAAAPRPALEAGTLFGSYRLDRELGMGGMGEVWLARRVDGRFEGTVALKVLHAHVAQSAARERFIREGRILGQLSHAHIARLIDAGATSLGVLYLVLEYVEGLPIDQWCDERRLDIEARLRLFLQVCEAVAHAHSHLVIHRDLKPSNILVSAGGEIKLLDFGIAKLIEPEKPAQETELTRLSGRALTPDFAAPEQILGRAVTTATDVYSLGVLLYVLLSGQRPHRRQHLSAGELERQALIAEPPPLVRAALPGKDRDAAAERRSTTPQRLERALASDLSTIVAKALRVEPERRYGGVEPLSADVGRYLTGLPVLAAPDTWAYRTRKFVSRHVAGVSVATAAALLLTAFAVLMSIQVQRTARERERAEQVSSFLVDVFELSDPYKGSGNDITARQLLEAGTRRVEEGFAAQPATRAALMGTMGRVYNRLGLGAEAQRLLEESLQGLKATQGPQSPEMAALENEIGNALRAQGKFDPAASHLQAALRLRQHFFGVQSPEVAETLRDLGNLAQDRGDNPAAESYFRDSLAQYQRLGLGATTQAAQSMNDLATLLSFLGKYSDSARLLEAALKIDRRALGEDHARVIMESHNLGFDLAGEGQFSAAEPLIRKSIEQMRRVFGPDHPYTIDALSNYGRLLRHEGNAADAEQVLREVLQRNLRVRGPNHSLVGVAQTNLGLALEDQGREPEAEEQFRAALDTYGRALPPDHPLLESPLSGVGRALVQRGRSAEAVPLLRRAVQIATASMPAESPTLAIARSSLGIALVALHQNDEAATLLRESYPIVLRTQGETSAITRQAQRAQTDLGRPAATPRLP